MTQKLHSPVIGIAGWKNSGKTTLVVRLVAELTRRGFLVATIKHSHHPVLLDDDDTDSARHRRAGARETAVVGPDRWGIVHELGGGPQPDLLEVVARLAPADIVLVEGYKSARIAKIEARRLEQPDKQPLPDEDGQIVAIAADHAVSDASNPRGLPIFALDDVDAIADMIERIAEIKPQSKSSGLSGL